MLPVFAGDEAQTFRPAPGFLSLLKFQFWIVAGIVGAGSAMAFLVISIAAPIVGVLLAPPGLAILALSFVVAYVALHLRYDTTWYVMTDRSLRLRRGIWIIHETTITFENVQNITVHQGPVERFFGIGNVLVQTAGGGSGQRSSEGQGAGLGMHRGLIEGVADAGRIRDLILPHLRQTQTAGLGDDSEHPARPAAWRPEHLAVLHEILAAARAI